MSEVRAAHFICRRLLFFELVRVCVHVHVYVFVRAAGYVVISAHACRYFSYSRHRHRCNKMFAVCTVV